MIEHVFDDDGAVILTDEEYWAYTVACHETPYTAEELPDPADFVRDEQQRYFDSRIRLLNTGAAHLDEAVAESRVASRAEASRARALAAFARSRPAAMFDRAPGERGAASAASVAARPSPLTEVSEWAVDEAAATLRISGRAASMQLVEAITLVEGLPATLAALAAGDISPAHARIMVEVAGPVADPDKRAQVEAAVLPRAVGQTPAALRASVRRAVTRIDAAAAAARLVQAASERQVRLETRDDGTSALTSIWTTPVGRACHEALRAHAEACAFDEDGNPDPRTLAQRMADCHADLILRPHADHPTVQVALTLVAGVDTLRGHGNRAEEPGELEADLVPAAQVRELAHELGLMPRPAPAPPSETASAPELQADTEPTAHAATAGDVETESDVDTEADVEAAPAILIGGDDPQTRLGSLRAAELAAARDFVAADDSAARRAAVTRLLDARRFIDTALAERPRIAITDQLTGSLLALTDSTELRAAAAAGRGLGPPEGTAAYQPTDPLYRFVRLRDRRCRFPGCRARARCCDLDHQVPHPHGPTAHDNLACLCEHHHRLSHQAPGWTLRRESDGTLIWTLPGGRTISTRPPAFGTDDCTTTIPPPRTRRQNYADALARIAGSRPVQRTPDIPF